MNKTKIEWADYSWNPIKGLCPQACWFCYARAMYKRFKWGDFIRLDYKELDCAMPKKPSKIFICSTIELFHPDINPRFRDHIFHRINLYPQHTFQILTKLPQNIDRLMPDNVWLGVSVTDSFELERRFTDFLKVRASLKFVSFEPLLDRITWGNYLGGIDWVIVGRLTGYGHKHDPEKRFIEGIVNEARAKDISIFLKDNLKDIWNEPLIQEFPE